MIKHKRSLLQKCPGRRKRPRGGMRKRGEEPLGGWARCEKYFAKHFSRRFLDLIIFLLQPSEDSAENLEVNRALTESVATGSSLAEVASTAASSVVESALSQQEREYTVIFDDDEEEEAEVISSDEAEVISSDEAEEEYERVPRTPPTKTTPSKPKRKKPEPKVNDEVLDGHIADSIFYVPVSKKLPNEDTKWTSAIGKVSFKLDWIKHDLTTLKLPEQPQCWVYISEIPGRSILYYEWYERRKNEQQDNFARRQKKGDPDHVEYFHIIDPKDVNVLEAFGIRQKMLHLKFHKYYEFSGVLEVKICINEDSLVVLNHPSDSRVTVPAEVKATLNYCFGVDAQPKEEQDDEDKDVVHDIDQLYKLVKAHHDKDAKDRAARVKVDPQHRSLLPKLRPYQAAAVRWMLEQERYHCNLDPDLEEEAPAMHTLYQEVRTQDGTPLYFSSVAGYLTKVQPKGILSPPGGILADEMGLGKTVEVLSIFYLLVIFGSIFS